MSWKRNGSVCRGSELANALYVEYVNGPFYYIHFGGSNSSSCRPYFQILKKNETGNRSALKKITLNCYNYKHSLLFLKNIKSRTFVDRPLARKHLFLLGQPQQIVQSLHIAQSFCFKKTIIFLKRCCFVLPWWMQNGNIISSDGQFACRVCGKFQRHLPSKLPNIFLNKGSYL